MVRTQTDITSVCPSSEQRATPGITAMNSYPLISLGTEAEGLEPPTRFTVLPVFKTGS